MSAAVFKQTIERAGLSVPGDVLLTGFSDMPIARLMTLPLTTGNGDVAPLGFMVELSCKICSCIVNRDMQ